jgi:hypothetical protein
MKPSTNLVKSIVNAGIVSTILCFSVSAASAQTTITQWNFNGITAGTIGTATPSTGAGTISLAGSTTHPNTGSAGSGSSDTALTNLAFQTTSYPAQSTDSGTAGVRFDISTAGFTSASYTSFTFSFDQRLSNTAANTWNVDFSTNGGSSWTTAQQFTFTPAATGTGDTWYNRSVSLTAPGIFNNPNVAFRVASAFAPSTSGYLAARSTSSYGTSSTSRFDMVTLSAIPAAIPEPSTYAAILGGVALVGVAARRRRSV